MITGEGGRAAGARLPPRTGILGARESRLSELVSGAAVTKVHELVDPARCRIWDGHNRDYAQLSEENCADLITSLRAQGRQEMAAVVRRVADDPAHDFEVVCGARRHWSVSWLRRHDYPDIRFLVEPRELTDEEAFRVADLENRNRKDLSDYERASDYARAIDRYYGGNQQRMVDRLQVTKSWLSRYLELARLPDEVVAAFGSPHAIGISHAAKLAPLLRVPAVRSKILARAEPVAAEQEERRASGTEAQTPAEVLRRLTTDRPAAKRRTSRDLTIHDASGTVLAKVAKGKGGTMTIVLQKEATRDSNSLRATLQDLISRLTA